MRRKVTFNGMREAWLFLATITFACGAIFIGGPRATVWAVMAALSAFPLLIGLVQWLRR